MCHFNPFFLSSFLSLSLSLLPSPLPYFPPLLLPLSISLSFCTSQGELVDPWILPVIQGYVEVRQIPVLCHETPDVLQAGGRRVQEERGRRGEATDLRSKNDAPMDWGSYEMVEMVKGQLSRVKIGTGFHHSRTRTVQLASFPGPHLTSIPGLAQYS